MSGRWQNSDRKYRLPKNWEQLRKQVHSRDNSQCQVLLPSGAKCLEPSTDVDHIRRGDDHNLVNLRCICDWHHKAKSAREGGAAYRAKINKSKKSFRRVEQHPAMLQ